MCMLTVLLTNDDGIDAPGLQALYQVCVDAPDVRPLLVAPDRQRSACSHLLHLNRPITLERMDDDRFAVDGAPADCVKIGLQLTDSLPAVVVSGINDGSNMGTDVIYSGTVAGAREGVINRIPGLAVSLAYGEQAPGYTFAARLTMGLVRYLLRVHEGDGAPFFYNLNVPRLPPGRLGPIRCTRLGQRVYKELITREQLGEDREQFVFGGGMVSHRPQAGSDLDAIAAGHISLTPLSLDSTDYQGLQRLDPDTMNHSLLQEQ